MGVSFLALIVIICVFAFVYVSLILDTIGLYIIELKLETTKIDLSRKEAENGALQTQIETLKKHWEDHERHISVLRDQIGTKEEQGAMLQADVKYLKLP